MEKKRFERPEMTIITFANEDIIVTSSGAGDPYWKGNDFPEIPED